jgi:hypothetical protein
MFLTGKFNVKGFQNCQRIHTFDKNAEEPESVQNPSNHRWCDLRIMFVIRAEKEAIWN